MIWEIVLPQQTFLSVFNQASIIFDQYAFVIDPDVVRKYIGDKVCE